jgi:demethoxyubiquinone hydroxylase (CLK1/Coq7/Cat5 family)
MLSQSIANIGLRISDMSELKAAAIANGNTKLVTKIEKRVAKFEREIGRKTAHIAREAARQQQVEVRCAVATPPAP